MCRSLSLKVIHRSPVCATRRSRFLTPAPVLPKMWHMDEFVSEVKDVPASQPHIFSPFSVMQEVSHAQRDGMAGGCHSLLDTPEVEACSSVFPSTCCYDALDKWMLASAESPWRI